MKNSRPLLLSKPVIAAGLSIAFSFAAGTAILSLLSIRGVSDADNEIAQTQTALLNVNQLWSALIDAETSQRGYLLSGKEHHVASYEAAIRDVPKRMQAVRTSLGDSPEQNASISAIDALVKDRVSELKNVLSKKQDQGLDAAIELMITDTGMRTMDTIRRSLAEIEAHEFQMLRSRSEKARLRSVSLQRTSAAMIGIAVLMTAAGVVVFMRRVNELETMITVCAWTKRVKYKGQWVSFEDYLHSRFKLEFTHTISEEAARKLMLEELELHPELKGFKRPPPRAS